MMLMSTGSAGRVSIHQDIELEQRKYLLQHDDRQSDPRQQVAL